MAVGTKFYSFNKALAEKIHNLGSDQLKIALCASANPPVATNTKLSDLTEISYTNISSRNLTTTSSTQSSGNYQLTINDLTLTASGVVPSFRYVVIYNDTATNKELIGWYDTGGDVSLLNTDTFLIDLDNINGFFQLSY